MATTITREEDAKRLLLPAGWEWMGGISPALSRERATDIFGNYITGYQPVWNWGNLQFVGPVTQQNYIPAYKALVEILVKYAVDVRIINFSAAGSWRAPVCVSVRPFTTGQLSRASAEYEADEGITFSIEETIDKYLNYAVGVHLNLKGWEGPWGQVPPGEFTQLGGVLKCQRCKRISSNLVWDPSDIANLYCRRCIRVCPGNGIDPCNMPIFNTRFRGCPLHYPRGKCHTCLGEFDTHDLKDHEGKDYCAGCLSNICQRCGAIGITPERVADNREFYTVCTSCVPKVILWVNQDKNEKFILEKPCDMLITSTPQRPVRLCSVELEITHGAERVIEELYKKGLSTSAEIVTYHQGDENSFAYMEQDSSLPSDGGELIFSKMRMDDPVTVSKLRESLGVLRRHIKNGDATIDLRTGAHVHIDAHKTGFNHIRNNAILFNYLEDVIYRLSAANYTRHRGTHYALVLPKGQMDSQAVFNQSFFRNNVHHSVLNVAYYHHAVMKNCGCGQIVAGHPDDCECQLGKCTVEFRVFNGTSSWKKLHAYIALCMSMVAYARNVEDMDVEDFPPNLYNPVGEINSKKVDEWKHRLVWTFENLYFTESEKDALMYCLIHSGLAMLPSKVVDQIANTQYQGNVYKRRKPPKQEVVVPPPLMAPDRNFAAHVQFYGR